ncbi:MAG: LysM peptidoglycan-binding domain-containing protein [Actinomycetia bacterium]|nr:LysM peptidoglycan-binding domain-containing protein [Actinomycetes bacterium]
MFGFGELNNDFDYDGDFDFTSPNDRPVDRPADHTPSGTRKPGSPDAAPVDSDPHDFWKHEPTRSMPRISSRRKPSTSARTSRMSRSAYRSRANRQHAASKAQVFDANGAIILDDTACRPFDGATDTGGMSRARPARTQTPFGGDKNPLLRRVGALMVLLALGVPVAMALRGDDAGRTISLGDATAIAAAQEAAATSSVAAAVDPATGAVVETPLATAAAEVAATVAAETAAPAAPAETAAPEQALPAAQPAVAAAPVCVKTYTVALGDGWLRIAQAHSITLDELLASNNASVSTFLLVGATICVPANAVDPTTTVATTPPPVTQAASTYVAPFSLPCAKTYTVVLGDGWLRIANKHNVEMKEVLAANAANASTFLMVGKKICVPANATTPTTAPPTTVKATPTTTKTTRPAPTPTINPPSRSYTAAEVEAIIREIWPDELEEEALRIAKRESHLNPRAQNYCCYGLFQIYFNVHKKWLAELGITSGEMLLDPTNAAKAGLRLYERNGWGPWKL